MPTPKQLLIEHLYGGDLPADVAHFIEAGKSWRDIAGEISDKTGQPVSYESLRQWYGVDRGRLGGAA
jgi:hypothetical protein